MSEFKTRQYRCKACKEPGHRAAGCKVRPATVAHTGETVEQWAGRVSASVQAARAVGWDEAKRQLIRDHYAAVGPTEMSKVLLAGHTPRAISSEAWRLGVSFRERVTTPAGDEEAKKVYPFGLDWREVQFVRAVAVRGSDKGAAKELGASDGYVSKLLVFVFRKMGVHNRMHMALKAERAGLLEGIQL